jgi:hypothetical protein
VKPLRSRRTPTPVPPSERFNKARPAIASVAADFAQVLSFLQAKGLVSATPPASLVMHAKRIHRATYSLILWRFRLKNLPSHGLAFVEEIASDALQLLPQVLMGYGKTAKLLTRGIVENTLRHLYFSDHPIEFAKMNRETKWYLKTEDLFGYLREHPAFMETEKRFDAISRLSSLYSDLSAGIHGRQVRDLEMRVALGKIAYSDQMAGREMAFIERCAESSNFLLAVFYRDKMNRFELEDRRIILRTMPSSARQVWTSLL